MKLQLKTGTTYIFRLPDAEHEGLLLKELQDYYVLACQKHGNKSEGTIIAKQAVIWLCRSSCTDTKKRKR